MDQPRDPPAPIIKDDVGKRIRRLGRDSPVSGPTEVGAPRAPRHSYGYDFVAPPWIRGCRAVTRPARGFQQPPGAGELN